MILVIIYRKRKREIERDRERERGDPYSGFQAVGLEKTNYSEGIMGPLPTKGFDSGT